MKFKSAVNYKFYSLAAATLALTILSGCSTQRAWVYSSDEAKAARSIDTTLVITPFIDQRDGVNKDNLKLAVVPLIPYTEAEYSVPEGKDLHVNSRQWSNYKPVEDFPKALVVELKQQQLFSNITYSDNIQTASYHVVGKILETKYEAKLYTYGLSFYAPVAWALGAPQSKVSNTLSLELTLIDDSGNTLLSKVYEAPQYEEKSWIYNVKNDFQYPVMLKHIYKDFSADIAALAL